MSISDETARQNFDTTVQWTIEDIITKQTPPRDAEHRLAAACRVYETQIRDGMIVMRKREDRA